MRLDRVLGDPIEMLGYAPETSIAEKGVTILERGITSTRWRDYIDIVQLARQGMDPDELLRSARAVARYRGIDLPPVTPARRRLRPDRTDTLGRLAAQGTTRGHLRREPRRATRHRRLPARPDLHSRQRNDDLGPNAPLSDLAIGVRANGAS